MELDSELSNFAAFATVYENLPLRLRKIERESEFKKS